ncbi:MAG TPA: peptide ABC transporter substrate-binding protein [Ktedonobacterales bacterium]
MRRVRMGDAGRSAGGRGGLATWLRMLLPLGGALVLLLSACGAPQSAGSGLAKNQILTWPIGGDTTVNDQVLDPAEVATATDYNTSLLVYSGLVTLDTQGRVVPDSASKIDVDPTGTVYTFHLLPGLKFSDGKPIRAADFAASIDRAIDPHLCDGTDPTTGKAIAYGNSPYGPNCFFVGGTYLNHILGANARIGGTGGSDHSVVAKGIEADKGINIVDDQTLTIRLDAPVPFFLEALTYPTSFPLEPSLLAKYPHGQWVNHLNEGGCSGPFEVKAGSSYAGAKQMVYVPNPYWEQSHHKQLTIAEIDAPYIQDTDTEYSNYRTGKYDITAVPGHDYSSARGQGDFNEVPSLQIDYFSFNVLLPPFDSLPIRQAFDLALNKQDLVDNLYNGGAIPTNHIVPQGMPGYDPGLLTPPPDSTLSITGNQSSAIKLMTQALATCKGDTTDPDYCAYIDAKHNTTVKPIVFYTNGGSFGNRTRGEVVQAAAAQWNRVFQQFGLNVQEQDVNFSVLIQQTCLTPGAHGYDAWAIGWIADYPDPQDWLSLQFASGGPDNCSKIANPSFDKLFLQADEAQTPSNRMNLYHQAEQDMVNYVGWLPYLQGKITWRQRSWVRGFSYDSQGVVSPLIWPNVYIAKQ